jgi:AcrR family transcriptional regulator
LVSEEQEDRRVRRTRRALQQALRDLMLEKAYDRITVQELLDRADIGRATFYAHFHDKDALLMSEFEAMREALREAMRQHLSTVPHAGGHASAEQRHQEHGLAGGRVLFEHAAERQVEYRALVRSRSGGSILKFAHQEITALLREHFEEAAVHTRRQPAVPAEITAQYVAGALLALLHWWLSQDSPCTAEEIGRMFGHLALPAVTAALGAIHP